mgnify:FL=1
MQLLSPPPNKPEQRKQWLAHAFGKILFQHAHRYALENIAADATPETKAAARKAAEDTLYGLMMILDGVVDNLENEQYRLALAAQIQLIRQDSGEVADSLDLTNTDGLCMVFHDWKEGKFDTLQATP